MYYFHNLRNDFLRSYHTVSGGGNGRDIMERAINSQAPQWYCDEQTASRALRRIERGQTAGMRPLVRLKYEDMLKRVKTLEAKGYGRMEAVSTVISSPAPRYYFGIRTAYRILTWQKKSQFRRAR